MATRRKPLAAISLFSGAGGLDLGFSMEGFDVRVAVELDSSACQTLRTNWPRLRGGRLIERPLETVSTTELLDVAGLEVGEAAIVFGGPPCQSWCVAGNRRGFDDPRGKSLLEFCRVVREARPKTFCIENVPGLLTYAGMDAVNLIADEINRGNGPQYELAAETLNAAEYGVPQHRRRVFIVGWRGAGEFCFPAATHQIESAPRRDWKRAATTVGDAFKGLPAVTPPSEQAHRVAATIAQRNERWYGKR